MSDLAAVLVGIVCGVIAAVPAGLLISLLLTRLEWGGGGDVYYIVQAGSAWQYGGAMMSEIEIVAPYRLIGEGERE